MTLPSATALIALAVFASACAALVPSNREMEYSDRRLAEASGVVESRVWCNDDFGATSDLCGSVRMNDGVELILFGICYRSFGEAADRVLVAEVGGLQPFVASCAESGTLDSAGRPIRSEAVSSVANFHRSGRFGNHLQPRLIDALDAVRRYRDVQSALEKWPRCPDWWAFEESGATVRYCVFESAALQNRPPVDPACAR